MNFQKIRIRKKKQKKKKSIAWQSVAREYSSDSDELKQLMIHSGIHSPVKARSLIRSAHGRSSDRNSAVASAAAATEDPRRRYCDSPLTIRRIVALFALPSTHSLVRVDSEKVRQSSAPSQSVCRQKRLADCRKGGTKETSSTYLPLNERWK